MAAGTGTIQGEFGWSNSPLLQGMGEAEVIAGRGAARVQGKFLDIFKRSPNMRAERAFQGLFQSIAAGDIAGGIEAISHRMTGLGIIAGVAIGAGVVIFQKFREQILATRDADMALQAEMRKPLSIITSLSNEGMEQALQAREKLGKDLAEKASKTFGSELSEAFQSMLSGPTFGAISGEQSGRERLGQQMDLNKNEADKKTIMQSQAELAQKLVELKNQEAFGDEHQARVGKILLETEQARSALKMKGLTHSAFEVADTAAQSAGGLALKLEDQRVTRKEKALELEEKMAKLIRGGLSAEDQKKVRASLELKLLDQQISSEGNSPEQKRALILQRAQKENEIRGFGNPNKTAENPFAAGTIAARNWESEQGGFGSIAARSKEAEDKGAFGSLANAAMLRGESPMAAGKQSESAAVVAAVNESKDVIAGLMRDAWLKP